MSVAVNTADIYDVDVDFKFNTQKQLKPAHCVYLDYYYSKLFCQKLWIVDWLKQVTRALMKFPSFIFTHLYHFIYLIIVK